MSGPDERHSRPMKQEGDIPFEVRETYARLQDQELDGPPDLVDQAVLNRARAAVEPPHSSRPWSFGWPHALSTVAVIVLSLTVLIQMREQAPPELSPSSPAPRALAIPDASRSADSAATEGTSLNTNPGISPASQDIAGANSEVAVEADREILADDVNEGASSMLMEAAEEAPANRVLQKSAARQRDAMDAENAPPARTADSVRDDPETWLLEIRQLQAAGLVEQAEEELALFRERWPDIPVPEDLQ